MGYRHEVVGVIAMPTLDFFTQQMARIKLENKDDADEAIDTFTEYSVFHKYTVECSPWTKEQLEKTGEYVPLPEGSVWYTWEFHHTDTKWWWLEPFWEGIKEKAAECGLSGGEWRIGEDSEDTDSGYFESDSMDKLEDYMKQLSMFSGSSDEIYKSYSRQYEADMDCVRDPYNMYTVIDIDLHESLREKALDAKEVLNGKV